MVILSPVATQVNPNSSTPWAQAVPELNHPEETPQEYKTEYQEPVPIDKPNAPLWLAIVVLIVVTAVSLYNAHIPLRPPLNPDPMETACS